MSKILVNLVHKVVKISHLVPKLPMGIFYGGCRRFSAIKFGSLEHPSMSVLIQKPEQFLLVHDIKSAHDRHNVAQSKSAKLPHNDFHGPESIIGCRQIMIPKLIETS